MLVILQPDSPVPLYDQVAGAIRRQIAEQRITAGDRLPPARELAEALGINLHTVLRGYQLLREEGLIELRRGRGAVVTDTAPDNAPWRAALDAFLVQARRAGLSVDEASALIRKGLR